MKASIACLLLALTGPLAPAQPSRAALASGSLAVTNVSVIPMTADTVLRDHTVLVRDGRIVAISPAAAARIPDDARRIDGRGKFLIPGLADMHTHLYSDDEVPDSLGRYEVGVLTANGITTARLMIGTPAQLALRREIEAGRVIGPQLWSASPQLTGRKDVNARVVTTPAEAHAAVREVAAAEYDFVKITNYITLPVYDAIIEEARARHIRVDGHVNPDVGVPHALASGQNLQHLDGYFEAALADTAPMKTSVTQFGVFDLENWKSLDYIDDRKIARLGGMTARAGVWVTPTLALFNTAFAIGQSDAEIKGRPDWRLMPQSVRDLFLRANARYWSAAERAVRTDARRTRYVDVRNKVVKAIADSGGKILAGSDAPEWFLGYGWTLHRELASLVAAGLTPYQALTAATRSPAQFLDATASWGTIEAGKRADLVLLGANPLDDIHNTTRIDGVALGGRWFARAALDSMVDVAVRRVNPSAATSQPGVVQSELVFPAGRFGGAHASTIVETHDGLLAAWFAGTQEGAADVGIWTSRRVGDRWTPPVEVATGVQSDGQRYPCWNPVLFALPNGNIALFYKVGPSPSAWWGMVRRSKDNGRTWSDAERLPNGVLGPIKNKPVALIDGTIISSSSVESPSGWRVHFERSVDGGNAWNLVYPARSEKEINAIQPSILIHKDGRLQAIGRSQSQRIFETWSSDGGKNWSPLALTTLPNPNAGIDALTLKDGRQLVVYNHTAQGRSPLNVAISADGVAWQAALVLENTPGEYSYPAVIQTADGLVHVTYTWKRQSIKHVVFDPKQLSPVAMPEGRWPAESAPPDTRELLHADSAWSVRLSTRPNGEALGAMFAPDVVGLLGGFGILKGRDALVAGLARHALAARRQAWTPLAADVSADGTHGWTFGFVELPPVDTGAGRLGKYVAFWRKDADNQWRVIAYLRNPRADGPVRASAPLTMGSDASPLQGDQAKFAAEVRAADSTFAAAGRTDVARAFTTWAAPNAIKLDGPGADFAYGRAEVGASMSGFPTTSRLDWRPLTAVVSPSGDLGFTIGTAEVVDLSRGTPVTGAKLQYLTIWRRQTDGTWRFVLDGGNAAPP